MKEPIIRAGVVVNPGFVTINIYFDDIEDMDRSVYIRLLREAKKIVDDMVKIGYNALDKTGIHGLWQPTKVWADSRTVSAGYVFEKRQNGNDISRIYTLMSQVSTDLTRRVAVIQNAAKRSVTASEHVAWGGNRNRDRRQMELEKKVKDAHATLDFKYDLGLPGGIEIADRAVKQAEKELADYMREKASRTAAVELLRVARSLMASPLDGMNKAKAARLVNNLMSPLTKGFFRDEDWSNVNKIWKALTQEGIDFTITKTEYLQDRNGIPNAKVWSFQIEFLNERSKPTILYGVVTASGAGSVENPLDRYDLVAYVS